MSTTDAPVKLHLFYVKANTVDEENVDLIVRAEHTVQATKFWREHYNGWDLPEEPASVRPIPDDNTPGAIDWAKLI